MDAETSTDVSGIAGVAISSKQANQQSNSNQATQAIQPPNMWSWVAIGVVGVLMLFIIAGVITFSVLKPGQVRN